MRVLIADPFEDHGVSALRAAHCHVEHRPSLNGAALSEALAETQADVLVVRSTSLTAAILDRGRLSLVVRAGTGVNTIDLAAATERGIWVANCAGQNAAAVAELAFGLMLALDRRIPDNVAALRAGIWNKKAFSSAPGLAGRTLGLLGYGPIGQEMVRRAEAFGMPTVVWSRRFAAGATAVGPGGRPVRTARTPLEVADAADVLSLHLALSPETRGIVDSALLGRMRPGSILINTSRAELVDRVALERAALDGRLRVGLDVFHDEPAEPSGRFSDPLVSLPNVYGTHHIGGSTAQAQKGVADETVRIITNYKNTGRVLNPVNAPTRKRLAAGA